MDSTSLATIARDGLTAAGASTAGRAATTVVGGSGRHLRQTVLSLAAGAELAEHANPGEATLYVLSGRVVLTAGTQTCEAQAGDLVVIPAEPHSLRALEPTAVLLTTVPLPAAG